MATKWETTYTDLTKVNGGNEYEDGDAITTDSVNVPIKNSAYAIQVANEAKIYAENAMNQTQREPVVEYVDNSANYAGITSFSLTKSGIYNIEIYGSFSSTYDIFETYTISIIYDKDQVGDSTYYPIINLSNTLKVRAYANRGYLEIQNISNGNKIKIHKIIRL